MAPRGRPKKKKVGLTRKDAAVDAMLVMGFPRKLINQTIAGLLKAYGGDEGWLFIEMDSYKALIEAILEKVVPEAECSQDYDLGGNIQRLSEAGSSNVPSPHVDEEVAPPLPPPGDGLDSGSQTDTVMTPPFAISESECNAFASPAEEKEEGAVAGHLDLQVSNLSNSMVPCSDEREEGAVAGPLDLQVSNLNNSMVPCSDEKEEGAVAGPLDQISNLSNSMVPCSDENPGPALTLVECNAFTSPAEGCEVAGPPDPDPHLSDSMAPCFDEHPAPTLSWPECKVLRFTAEESQVPGRPEPDPNLDDSMAPCFAEHPAPVLSSMSDKHRPPCHGWRKRPWYDEPTEFVELEPSPLPEKLLKLLGRDICR